MEPLTIECLRCGISRAIENGDADHADRPHPGECPRCGYLGWAPSAALTEAARRRIREQPPERRVRLYPV